MADPDFVTRDPAAGTDNQLGRAAAFEQFMAAALALPFGSFNTLLRAAAEHAVDPARADPQALPWICRGPRNLGGRIAALVQEPGNPRVIYAGSAHGGLWKSDNAGDTWRPLAGFAEGAANKEVAAPVGAIGICWRQSQTVWVGTGEPRGSTHQGFGLYRTDDGGATFTRVDPAPGFPAPAAVLPGQAFNRIIVDPWNANRVWIATPAGLWDIEPTRPPATRIAEVNLDAPGLAATGLNITDIAVDFGDKTQAAPPAAYTFYIGVELPGARSRVLKASWSTVTRSFTVPVAGTAWTDTNAHTTANIIPPVPVGGFHRVDGRVRIALCESQPQNVCAVFGTTLGTPAPPPPGNIAVTTPHSRVVTSANGGGAWAATAAPPTFDTIPWYALCLEMHPTDPRIMVMGCMDLFATTNGGAAWNRIINWLNYDAGDRAQHADQHAIFYDQADPRRIWIGNDGGISMSPNLGATWRKRSHGIIAAQFYEFAVHPTFPFIMGGGLQDNGSWIGLGGASWYQVGVADGGGLAFQPGRTDVLAATHQVGAENVQLTFQSFATLAPPGLGQVGGGTQIGVHLPDRPMQPGPTFPFLVARSQSMMVYAPNPPAGNHFGRPMEGHATAQDSIVIAWQNDVRVNGSTTPAFSLNNNPPNFAHRRRRPTGLTGIVTAIGRDPRQANTIWIGTSSGQVFRSTNAGASYTLIATGAGPNEITGIAVHPRSSGVVAISTAALNNNVLISTNALSGASVWRAISNASGTPAPPSAANRDLPSSPCAQVAFDPVNPPNSGGGTVFTLFAATLGGVYVTRLATPRNAVAPLWFAMNRDMPVVLTRDLDVAETLRADGSRDRRILRAATFGRGLWECDLGGTPDAALYIRGAVTEDGRSWLSTQALGTDPRLNVPGTGAPAADLRRSVDIRIDAAPFSTAADEVVDGADLDESLRSDNLVRGDRNFVYVQVHSRGRAILGNPAGNPPPGTGTRPQVHVYFANAVAPAAAGQPFTAPPLQAGFWGAFPADPAPDAVWRKAGVAEVSELSAANPRVARLDWGAPDDLGPQVAILAVADHPSDPVSAVAGSLPLAVDPGTAGALIPGTARAALYITQAGAGGAEDIFLRDGIGDTGAQGEVAWGGRSADIVVVQALEAAPDTAFASLIDARAADHIQPGIDNHIYVRVWNRSSGARDVTVDLWAVPQAEIARPANWVRIGAQVTAADVPARGSKFAPVLTWPSAQIPDPAPQSAIKSHILVALIGSPADPVPDHTGITSLAGFWEFFLAGANANKAAMRAVRQLP